MCSTIADIEVGFGSMTEVQTAVIPEHLEDLLNRREDEHLEFKEAKPTYDFEKLTKYCVALANEGGGMVVLGVTNARPRRVVGTRAFSDLERAKSTLTQRLHHRVDAEERDQPAGRVLIFDVPPRPLGRPIEYKGAYWMRSGDALVPMQLHMLQRILGETGPDFSAECCPQAEVDLLDPVAMQRLRERWGKKTGRPALDRLSDAQLLRDAELITDEGVTYAALILLGTRDALARHLSQAEVILEYRSSPTSIGYQQRREYREGFFLFDDEFWQTVNLRNEVQSFQDGLFRWQIPTFNETVVRESILNAICHRDYRLAGSVFVKQSPREFQVVSPGGFPQGITPENILDRQAPRNRRIAETLARCGLVERSGQGMDLIFEESIKEGKQRPDFTDSDDHQVCLTLRCDIGDPRFLRFLETVGRETQASFDTRDFVILDLLHREQEVPERLRGRLSRLRDLGVLELVSGRRYILSRTFYGFLGKKGVYTRRRGLDRTRNRELLLKHICDSRRTGVAFREFFDVLPGFTRGQIRGLLRELTREERAHSCGVTKAARWYPGPATP